MKTNYARFFLPHIIGPLVLITAIGHPAIKALAQTESQALAAGAGISSDDGLSVAAGSVQALAAQPLVSFHAPDGMILSTGNIYFTSHDAAGAHVFRTGQTSLPGQEIEIYHEPPGSRFGDIVFANVGGVFYGYFFATGGSGATIKRILLTGSAVAAVLTPPIWDIDIVNSHHNLATDGAFLYWQDGSGIRKMPIGGGAITTLDSVSPNTPTAGVYLSNGNIIYASVNALRYVPVGGSIVNPLFRTIANAATTITTILPVANGVYWGDRNGKVFLRIGSTTYTIQSTGLIPGSMGTNGYTAGGALVWTQCASTSCQLVFDFPSFHSTIAISGNALGASINSSGNVFWGDSSGVHRLVF